jgi:hypothetical protein
MEVMQMNINENPDVKRLLASLTPDALDSLADLIILKLKAAGSSSLLSKQVVTGSNPVSRSILNIDE